MVTKIIATLIKNNNKKYLSLFTFISFQLQPQTSIPLARMFSQLVECFTYPPTIYENQKLRKKINTQAGPTLDQK